MLFDELCAGTDPAEGAALAISIIEFCRKCGAGVAATTHYAELKLYAMRTSGVMNASCEFNVETLQPTYRLLIGVPGKSNAFAISKRLGIDEAILEQARSLVSQNDVNFEDVLTQLDQQRQEMEKAKEEAERLRRETEKQKEKSDEYYAQIKQEKEKAAQQARKEAQYIIDDARRAADAVYEELKQLRKQAKNGAFVPGSNEKQAQMRRSLNEAESRMQPQREEKQRPEPTRAIRVGDTVELLKLGTKASVLAINKDGSYQLRAGIMQITAKPEEVYLLENETQNAAKRSSQARCVSSGPRRSRNSISAAWPWTRRCRCSIISWTRPIWAISQTHALSTARARASCAQPCRRSCAAANTSSPSASAFTARANPASRSSNSNKSHRFLSGNRGAMK